MKIPDDFKRDLLARANIVDVVSKYVPIDKKGKDYIGLCPFHDEDTPSFTVSESKGFYHCFGCTANGDALDFIMDYRGHGFRAAMAELADMYGMKLPEDAKPKTDPWIVKRERELAEARRLLEALEPKCYVMAIGMADALSGKAISEQDKTAYYSALQIVLRCIESSKRRKLTEEERRHILGAEYPEHLEQLQQEEVA